jgi:hypothetical protein
MKPLIYTISLIALGLSTSAFTQSIQDEPSPRYNLKGEPQTGSNIGHQNVIGSKIPLNKRYAELTSEEKQALKKQFPAMAENDEPPFPLYGLGKIYKDIAAVQGKLLSSGEIRIDIEIDENGEGVTARVIKSPDQDATQYIASVLMLEKYKPAICDGKPCKMFYPFSFQLTKKLL